jgi:hypothetical protein
MVLYYLGYVKKQYIAYNIWHVNPLLGNTRNIHTTNNTAAVFSFARGDVTQQWVEVT